MQLIRIRFKGPTDSKPARFFVSDGLRALTVPYHYEDFEQECLQAAQAFCKQHKPLAPALHPEPMTFKSDIFYRFNTPS